MPSQSDRAFISSKDFIRLENVEGLPYLRHIGLVKYTPRHFGLEKWTRLFVIPDIWMRKIYRDEVWKDTEVDNEHEIEQLDEYQKRILNEWLIFQSPFSDLSPLKPSDRRSSKVVPESNDLTKLLNKSVDLMSSDDCDRDYETCDVLYKERKDRRKSKKQSKNTQTAKIEIHQGHHIQPESVIVERALEKMKHLPPEREKEFQDLLKDEEYMQFLSDNVKKYLEQSGVIN